MQLAGFIAQAGRQTTTAAHPGIETSPLNLKILKTLTAWSILLFVLAGIGVIVYLTWMTSNEREAIFEARKLSPIACQDGTSENTRPWRKMDTIRYCEPAINGPVQVWSGAFLSAEGEFLHGRQHGRWTMHAPLGQHSRIVIYNNGEVVSDETTPH